MDLFEYQGKQYFAQFGLPVSAGDVASNVDEAVKAANEAGYPVVVKAQVLVGGRGKAGGIKIAENEDEVRAAAEKIIGMDIKGHTSTFVWVEHASDIKKEYYASFTLDRGAKQYLAMVSKEGGVEIEQVAEENPDAIIKLHIDPVAGLTEAQARSLVTDAQLDDEAVEGAVKILMDLYRVFVEGDADLAEVNPLILTPDDRVHCLDAKVTLDDNAMYRHEEWAPFRATEVLDERETFAREKDLNYIGLDGTVGIIGNGAGLVMSTLDVINQAGGSPANFLDVGGGAGAELLANAIEVVNSDPKVKSIFINIFGGITQCDLVAQGIVEALGRVDVKSPIVVRLDGTNAEEGRAILQQHESDSLQMAPTMLEAAGKVVALAGAK